MTEKEIPENLPAVQSGNEFLEIVRQVALNPEGKVDVIERLIAAKERMEANAARKAYNEAMLLMRPKLPTVLKNKWNEQTKSWYADLTEINIVIREVLPEYQFRVNFRSEWPDDKHVRVYAVLTHVLGHSEENPVQLPYDEAGIKGTVNKTPVHAIASSITYAERYALCGILNIITSVDEDGNKPVDFITTEQAVEIDLKIKEVKADKEKFLEFMGVPDVRQIRMREFKKAMFALKQKGKAA